MLSNRGRVAARMREMTFEEERKMRVRWRCEEVVGEVESGMVGEVGTFEVVCSSCRVRLTGYVPENPAIALGGFGRVSEHRALSMRVASGHNGTAPGAPCSCDAVAPILRTPHLASLHA